MQFKAISGVVRVNRVICMKHLHKIYLAEYCEYNDKRNKQLGNHCTDKLSIQNLANRGLVWALYLESVIMRITFFWEIKSLSKMVVLLIPQTMLQ